MLLRMIHRIVVMAGAAGCRVVFFHSRPFTLGKFRAFGFEFFRCINGAYKPLEQLVVDALGTADSLSSDQISYQTGLAPAALTDVLFDLEDLNAIKRLPGNRFRLKN